MSDGVPVTVVGGAAKDPLFDGKTNEEIEALLDAFGRGETATEPPPAETVVEEAAPPEPEPPKEEPPAPVEDEQQPPGDEEIDLEASEREGEKIARERIEAQLAAQMAHSSRLAGELGFLRKQLEARPASATEPYQPESPEEITQLQRLEREVAAEKALRIRSDVQSAIQQVVASIEPELKGLDEEVAAIAPKYTAQFQSFGESTDPALARQMAEATLRCLVADAKEAKWHREHKERVELKASTAAKRTAAKQASSTTGSGGVSAPAPKPKALGDMTADEADKWLRENVP